MNANVRPANTGRYPLKVQQWGEDGEVLLSKGHHPPCAFLRRAIRLLAHDGGSDGRRAARELLADLGHDEVDHQWWRHAPSPTMGAGTEWEGVRFYRQATGPGRGCFPVTVVRIG